MGVTKGLQDRNNLLLDERTVENKGKLILTEIFPLVQKHDILKYWYVRNSVNSQGAWTLWTFPYGFTFVGPPKTNNLCCRHFWWRDRWDGLCTYLEIVWYHLTLIDVASTLETKYFQIYDYVDILYWFGVIWQQMYDQFHGLHVHPTSTLLLFICEVT